MNEEIELFEGFAPGSEDLQWEEERFKLTDEKDGKENDYIRKVLMPKLVPFPAQNPSGHCVIVIPGGGYRRQVLTKEGLRITAWLNSLGISAFVLMHRMPGDGHRNDLMVPLQDVQRAIRLLRHRADEYGFDRNKVGVMGFSAGAHVAATLSTSWDKETYPARDAIDNEPTRPDFTALIYPVISLHSYAILGNTLPQHAEERGDIIGAFPTDKLIRKDSPRTFIVGADDDITTPSENCVNYYLNLRQKGIPAEMHIFRNGGHGFGLGQGRGNAGQWPPLFAEWLKEAIPAKDEA